MQRPSLSFYPLQLSFVALALAAILTLSGCLSAGTVSTVAQQQTSPPAAACPLPISTGTPWVPNVAGASTANYKVLPASDISPAPVVRTVSGSVFGIGQPIPTNQEFVVTIPMDQDLGVYGSLTLMAEVTQFPSALGGAGYPLLVSLSDGVNEYVNLARSGAGGDCVQSGYWTCSGPANARQCSRNAACAPQSPSAYQSRFHWENQMPTDGSLTTTIFPTCNWAGGAGGGCAFVDNDFFPTSPSPRRLRFGTGVTYTARYVVVADSYETVSAGRTATIKVTAVRKADTTSNSAAQLGGAVDLNIVLVGNESINDSRTAKGKQNLDLLFAGLHNHFSQANSNIKLGKINVYEWPCALGGDTYSNLAYDSIGEMLANGSASFNPADFNREINVFLVNRVQSPFSGSTILGVSGGIGGPAKNATRASGLVFTTQGKIDTFNPNCASGNPPGCTVDQQDPDFREMSSTIAHEIGHFLGLNHPSESSGTRHDPLGDTPVCTATAPSDPFQTCGSSVAGGSITLCSCRLLDTNGYLGNAGDTCAANCAGYSASAGSFCPAAAQCQFNHIMWWTTKNSKTGTVLGDGNLFSSQSGAVMSFHPLVR